MIIEKGNIGIRATTQTVSTTESFILLRRYLLTCYSVFQEAAPVCQWNSVFTGFPLGTLQ